MTTAEREAKILALRKELNRLEREKRRESENHAPVIYIQRRNPDDEDDVRWGSQIEVTHA